MGAGRMVGRGGGGSKPSRQSCKRASTCWRALRASFKNRNMKRFRVRSRRPSRKWGKVSMKVMTGTI
jgi:hypothetical protein